MLACRHRHLPAGIGVERVEKNVTFGVAQLDLGKELLSVT
jgi:hypothetical protein